MSDSHRITLPAAGVTPVPVAGEAVTGSTSSEVSSPFDGARLGAVPLLGDAEVARAVAAASSALADQPLAPWQRADILDKAAMLLRERQHEFAQIIATKPPSPSRPRCGSRPSCRNVCFRRCRGSQTGR